VGLVIFPEYVIDAPPDELLEAVWDSKALTHARRLAALEIIQKHALFARAAMVSHRTVDRLNVNGATEFALRRLVARVEPRPGASLRLCVFA